MAAPAPTSTYATVDVFPTSPLAIPLFVLVVLCNFVTSEGTKLHTIMTTPSATRPTPSAQRAYWEPVLLPSRLVGERLLPEHRGCPLEHIAVNAPLEYSRTYTYPSRVVQIWRMRVKLRQVSLPAAGKTSVLRVLSFVQRKKSWMNIITSSSVTLPLQFVGLNRDRNFV